MRERAGVACVSNTVQITVFLLGVLECAAIIDRIGLAVVISVQLTQVPCAVAVAIHLIGIRNKGTIVFTVHRAVLIRIIACVADVIQILIHLIRIEEIRAVIARVADPIQVPIRLRGIGTRRCVVTGIANAVVILVSLARVFHGRAVILSSHDAIAIRIFMEEFFGAE